MKFESPKHKYELPVAGSAWIQNVELGAGIFFLEGRTHVAGHRSPAERELLERGAFLIATLRFERDPLEASHPDHPIHALDSRAALQRFGGGSSRN